jgi:hypothetical protein
VGVLESCDGFDIGDALAPGMPHNTAIVEAAKNFRMPLSSDEIKALPSERVQLSKAEMK